MAQALPPSAPSPSSSRLYGAMWALLALAAAGYVGTLIYKPDMLGGGVKHPLSNQESNKGERSLSKAVAKLKRLKHNVRRLKNEITRLKAIDAATAQNSDALNIPAAAKATSRTSLPLARKLPKTNVTAVTRAKTSVAAAKPRAPAKPTPVTIAPRTKSAPINRKSASELAARFSDAADQNGKPRVSNPLNTGTMLAKLSKTTGTAKAAVKMAAQTATKPSAPNQALKGVKIISKTASVTSQKTAPQKPAVLIGKATRPAGRKLGPAKIVKTSKIVRTVKTTAIKVPRTKTKTAAATLSAKSLRKSVEIQTGSVRPKPPIITFGAPVVRRARRPIKVALRLSAASSKAELQVNWLALKDRYGEMLQGMGARYETLGSSANRRYRLLAGPLDSAARALSVCDHFNASNITCTVSSYTGRKL